MKEAYRTVSRQAEAEIVEKRSRFIATVRPVSCEEEAVEFIEKLKKQYWDARHNVYAYIIEENNIQRYSDDGEPAGTAGVPVLEMIKKEGLSNIVVVVTRYFGGILLGTGGLVHAYSKSAKAGVEAAEPISVVLCRSIKVFCDYSFLGKVQSEIAGKNFKILDTQYGENVVVEALIPQAQAEAFSTDLIDKTNGKIKIEFGEVGYNKI